MPGISRRRFLATTLGAIAARARAAATPQAGGPARGVPPPAGPPLDAVAADLQARFGDLRRHFVFEYYPWYETDPYGHWNEAGRRPPFDIASNYMPLLGPYASASRAVLEQHARWIAQSGAGAVNVSWWGRDGQADRVVPRLMDVMRDHDIQVTFHLEPYADAARSTDYVSDLLYLLREYGEKRRWDAFLLLEHADGSVGPVFKSFATILPQQIIDCHGVRHLVRQFAPDGEWRRQTDTARESLRRQFDRIILLADSLDVARTAACGFDGSAIYDNYVRPSGWSDHAAASRERDLLFSFNVNPGFDGVVLREVEPDSCYSPPPFEPPGRALDWTRAADREEAAARADARIRETFDATLRLQADPSSPNTRRGFFLTYINSFNEWHEGHQFEPMKDAGDLRPEERAFGYHNPPDGARRLATLRSLLQATLEARGTPPRPPRR